MTDIDKAHEIQNQLKNYLTVLSCDISHTRVVMDFIILKLASLENKINTIIEENKNNAST